MTSGDVPLKDPSRLSQLPLFIPQKSLFHNLTLQEDVFFASEGSKGVEPSVRRSFALPPLSIFLVGWQPPEASLPDATNAAGGCRLLPPGSLDRASGPVAPEPAFVRQKCRMQFGVGWGLDSVLGDFEPRGPARKWRLGVFSFLFGF